jgi:hypothetical protein
MLRLRDGSVVEAGERAEFSVEATRKDTTVRLNRGNIIVQAAKRREGHLFVAGNDYRVAVTGTVFSVNRGVKGSRVSVIEGEVIVERGRNDRVLHAGDQLATTTGMGTTAIEDEIAWSRNLTEHLALLQEFAKLKTTLEQVRLPGTRHASALLDSVPPDTLIYLSVPNLGQALTEAQTLVQDQVRQSTVLRQWWEGSDDASIQKGIEQLRALSEYLGEEMVFAMAAPQNNTFSGVFFAEVHRPGLREFLQREAAKLTTGRPGIRVIEGDAPIQSTTRGEFLVVLRNNRVAMGEDPARIQHVLEGKGQFSRSAFGQELAEVFQRGTGIVFGADLHALIARETSDESRRSPAAAMLGVTDVRYLIAEQREAGGRQQQMAAVTFEGPRTGIASWLDAPGSVGGLEYVSSDAQFATSVVIKDPARALDEFLPILSSVDPNAGRDFSEMESELGVSLRNDIAAALGGEATFAIDGPLFPVPSWKLVVEVKDQATLQRGMERLVNTVSQQKGQQQSRLELTSQAEGDLTYYAVRASGTDGPLEIHYTFRDGYMILGPSRALVAKALEAKSAGTSLVRSRRFRDLLPRDPHSNFSAMMYQNAGEAINLIAEGAASTQTLSSQQKQMAREVAANLKPMLVCVYGERERIEMAANGSPVDLLMQSMLGPALSRRAHGNGTTGAKAAYR